jgi:uncharacterized membrane protein YciS (DUF1049 family)
MKSDLIPLAITFASGLVVGVIICALNSLFTNKRKIRRAKHEAYMDAVHYYQDQAAEGRL